MNIEEISEDAEMEPAFVAACNAASLKRKTHLPIPKPKRKKKEMDQVFVTFTSMKISPIRLQASG